MTANVRERKSTGAHAGITHAGACSELARCSVRKWKKCEKRLGTPFQCVIVRTRLQGTNIIIIINVVVPYLYVPLSNSSGISAHRNRTCTVLIFIISQTCFPRNLFEDWDLYLTVASWYGEGRGTIATPLNFGLAKNFLFVGKFSSKRAKFVAEVHILDHFRGNIKILSIRNLICGKFAAVCRKIATSYPSYFFTHDAAGISNEAHSGIFSSIIYISIYAALSNSRCEATLGPVVNWTVDLGGSLITDDWGGGVRTVQSLTHVGLPARRCRTQSVLSGVDLDFRWALFTSRHWTWLASNCCTESLQSERHPDLSAARSSSSVSVFGGQYRNSWAY